MFIRKSIIVALSINTLAHTLPAPRRNIAFVPFVNYFVLWPTKAFWLCLRNENKFSLPFCFCCPILGSPFARTMERANNSELIEAMAQQLALAEHTFSMHKMVSSSTTSFLFIFTYFFSLVLFIPFFSFMLSSPPNTIHSKRQIDIYFFGLLK